MHDDPEIGDEKIKVATCDRSEVYMRGGGYPSSLRKRALAAQQRGKTAAQIADTLGISAATVRSWIREEAKSTTKPTKSPAPGASWLPFARGDKGKLFLLQAVGYGGVSVAHDLFFGDNTAALGRYFKQSPKLVARHTPSWVYPSASWREFLERHQLSAYSDEQEEPSLKQIVAAIQSEPDALVADLFGNFDGDPDSEGRYSNLVIVSDKAFLDMKKGGRAAWFAPVLDGSLRLFQLTRSDGYQNAETLFLRARSRAAAFSEVVNRRAEASLKSSFDAMCRVERTAGDLDEDPKKRSEALVAMSGGALERALGFAYSKDGSWSSISLNASNPPWAGT